MVIGQTQLLPLDFKQQKLENEKEGNYNVWLQFNTQVMSEQMQYISIGRGKELGLASAWEKEGSIWNKANGTTFQKTLHTHIQIICTLLKLCEIEKKKKSLSCC